MTNFLTALAIAVAWVVFGYLICVLATLADPKPGDHGKNSDGTQVEWTPGMTLMMSFLWPLPLFALTKFTIERVNKRTDVVRYILGWPSRFLYRLDHRRDGEL